MESLFNSWNLQRTPSGNLVGPSDTVNHGLDPLLIKSFPTIVYSSIKDFRREKYGLECAICLVEFEDDSLLRLLTVCYHVFHQECIDLWLESHTTCPVCRRNLDSPPQVAEDECFPDGTYDHSVMEHVISIDVHNDDDNDNDNDAEDCRERQCDDCQPQSSPTTTPSSTLQLFSPALDAAEADKCERQNKPEKFSRSHSTGHSIVRNKEEEESEDEEEEDRYTLRVPKHVKLKLIRGHHWTKSCMTYGELCRHNANGGGGGGGFREVSGCSCAAGDHTAKY